MMRALLVLTLATAWPACLPAQRPRPSRTPAVPSWPWPGDTPAHELADSAVIRHVPESDTGFSLREVADRFAPPDWHPGRHSPMPDVVAHGRRPDLFACGYCHMPNGAGRPENAALAGLPEAYIVAQVIAFRAGERRSAFPQFHPASAMILEATTATTAEVFAAARYFSRLPFTRTVRVVETDRVPATRQVQSIYVPDSTGRAEPIGARIIEVPEDVRRYELRDDAAGYVAWVPRGSIARGRTLAQRGVRGPKTACTSCHGANLEGVDRIPPLAGRYPTYIVRQLLAIRAGARATPSTQPMAAVVAGLSLRDMIAVAAYAASLDPPAAHH